MSRENINFDDKKTKKASFTKKKKLTSMGDVNVNKILVSKKESYGTNNSFKYFIGYSDNDVSTPLCVRLPQLTGYARKFDENATMSFRANNKQLSKYYNKIWGKVEKLMRIDFESKPVYGDDDKCIKTKIKIYAGSVITNFHDKKKMPKEKVPCKCLSLIMLDSVIKANKTYYPQILVEERKYVWEKIKTEDHINDDLEKSESDSDSNDEIESDIDNDEYDE